MLHCSVYAAVTIGDKSSPGEVTCVQLSCNEISCARKNLSHRWLQRLGSDKP